MVGISNYTSVSDAVSSLNSFKLVENNFQNSIIIALLLLFASFAVARVLMIFIHYVVKRLTAKTKTRIDDLIVERTEKPLLLLVLLLGFRIAIFPLLIPEFIEKILIHLDYSAMIATIFFMIGRSINVIIDEWGRNYAKKTKSAIDEQLLSLFHKFVNVLLIIFTIIFILQVWGVRVTPFLASLGIAGLAVGLALQTTLSNIFGGIQLIVDKTMQVGDTVKVGTDIFGTVEEIGIRSTRIRTFDNELLIVPNGQLSNLTIQNYAQPEEMLRVGVDFGVEYGSDPKKVKKVVEEALKKNMSDIMKNPPPKVDFMLMGDFALQFKAYVWIDTHKKRVNTKVELTNLVYETLKNNKINIPFPTRTLYMKKSDS